jgi:hypothetical protein
MLKNIILLVSYAHHHGDAVDVMSVLKKKSKNTQYGREITMHLHSTRNKKTSPQFPVIIACWENSLGISMRFFRPAGYTLEAQGLSALALVRFRYVLSP